MTRIKYASTVVLFVFSTIVASSLAFSMSRSRTMTKIPYFSSTRFMSHAPSADDVFEKFSSKIVTGDKKTTNLELVNRGQKFGSYKRRFDYSFLFPENDSLSSEWVKEYDVKSLSSLDNSCSDQLHLKNLIRSCANIDRMVNTDNERSMSQAMLVDEKIARMLRQPNILKVDTDPIKEKSEIIVGLNPQLDRLNFSSVNGLNVLDACIDVIKSIHGGTVIQKSTWTGDVHTTHVYTHRGNDSLTNLQMVIRRKLVHSTDSGSLMHVEYTLASGNDDNGERVHYREFYKTSNFGQPSQMILSSTPQRVPGCVANVSIQTTLIQNASLDTTTYRVIVDGEADAILSRGILSVLQEFLSSESITSDIVLEMDSFTFADRMNLRNVLSTGRNDGLASMISIVQQQIKDLLGIEQECEELQNKQMVKSSFDGDEKKTKGTVAMLLSGGVDSSVALNLLVREGYDVTAFYLKIWLEDELTHLGQCPWEDDYKVCVQVCEQAGVPLEAISLQNEYNERVISYTISEAKKGRTPNPDIMCNSRVKFGCFYDAISERDFDYVATGHYAQLKSEPPSRRLYRAPDSIKDQSYFLAALTQEQLNKVLFPIGKYEKSEVRELAKEFDLPNKNRPDSQGLCFLGKVKFDEFLSAYLGNDPGDIIDAETGEVIGRHNGIWFHTVGQRKGIGKVLFPLATSRGPWYVVAKDTQRKQIVASNKYDEGDFDRTRREFYVEDLHWIASPPDSLSIGVHLSMKIRHGPTIVNGMITSDNGADGKIILDKKDGGLAPGQFVAFYQDEECLGSAVISEKHWLKFLDMKV